MIGNVRIDNNELIFEIGVNNYYKFNLDSIDSKSIYPIIENNNNLFFNYNNKDNIVSIFKLINKFNKNTVYHYISNDIYDVDDNNIIVNLFDNNIINNNNDDDDNIIKLNKIFKIKELNNKTITLYQSDNYINILIIKDNIDNNIEINILTDDLIKIDNNKYIYIDEDNIIILLELINRVILSD